MDNERCGLFQGAGSPCCAPRAVLLRPKAQVGLTSVYLGQRLQGSPGQSQVLEARARYGSGQTLAAASLILGSSPCEQAQKERVGNKLQSGPSVSVCPGQARRQQAGEAGAGTAGRGKPLSPWSFPTTSLIFTEEVTLVPC